MFWVEWLLGDCFFCLYLWNTKCGDDKKLQFVVVQCSSEVIPITITMAWSHVIPMQVRICITQIGMVWMWSAGNANHPWLCELSIALQEIVKLFFKLGWSGMICMIFFEKKLLIFFIKGNCIQFPCGETLLTHLPLVPHRCLSELGQHWSR